MANNFDELMAKMAPEAQAQAEELARVTEVELPPNAIADLAHAREWRRKNPPQATDLDKLATKLGVDPIEDEGAEDLSG